MGGFTLKNKIFSSYFILSILSAVVDDDVPEGDEEFAVNITSVIILKPTTG